MTVTTSVRTVNRLFTIRSGTYGPSHDPYGWEEWEVTDLRTGESAKIRSGGLTEPDPEEWEAFETKSGFSPTDVEHLIGRWEKHQGRNGNPYGYNYKEADEQLLRYARC